jgi:hypothetical protein
MRQYLPWFLVALSCVIAAGLVLRLSRRRRRRYTSDRRQWWAG